MAHVSPSPRKREAYYLREKYEIASVIVSSGLSNSRA